MTTELCAKAALDIRPAIAKAIILTCMEFSSQLKFGQGTSVFRAAYPSHLSYSRSWRPLCQSGKRLSKRGRPLPGELTRQCCKDATAVGVFAVHQFLLRGRRKQQDPFFSGSCCFQKYAFGIC